MNRSLFFSILILFFSGNVSASEQVVLDQVTINVHNKPSLQRGAKIFVNNCLGCHTLKYQRYSKFINHLGMSKKIASKLLPQIEQ